MARRWTARAKGFGLVGVLAGTACSPGSDASDGSEATAASDEGSSEVDASTGGSSDAADGSESGNGGQPPSGAWSTMAPLAEGPRQETGVAALDGKLYVVGGFTPDGVVPRMEAYDPSADAWQTVAAFPVVDVHHANTAAAGGRLWVTGFLTGLQFVENGGVYEYVPANDEWLAHDPMPAGTERGASGVAVLDDAIYVLGGLRGGAAVADASMYDPVADVWTTLPDLPMARDHLIAAGVGGRVYAIGGRDAAIGGHVTAVDVWDPSTESWSEGPPMPTSRGGMAAAVVGSLVFVAGGEGNPDLDSGVFEQFEVFDADTDTWHTLPPMPMPRHGTGAAAIEGVVYVPGGADVQAFGAVDTHEAFTLQ